MVCLAHVSWRRSNTRSGSQTRNHNRWRLPIHPVVGCHQLGTGDSNHLPFPGRRWSQIFIRDGADDLPKRRCRYKRRGRLKSSMRALAPCEATWTTTAPATCSVLVVHVWRRVEVRVGLYIPRVMAHCSTSKRKRLLFSQAEGVIRKRPLCALCTSTALIIICVYSGTARASSAYAATTNHVFVLKAGSLMLREAYRVA